MATGQRRWSDTFKWISAQRGMIRAGTSTTDLAISSTPPIRCYFSSSSTAASTSIESLYIRTNMTGAAGVGGRARFHTYSNVASGGWINAIKGFMEFGASGSASGLASAICAEISMPASSTGLGTYCAGEFEIVCPTSWAGTGPVAFQYMNTSGATAANFDTYGLMFYIGTGVTPAATKFVSATSQTLKCRVEANTRYMLLSQMEDGLRLGTDATAPMDFGTTSAANAIDLFTTSASTDGTSVNYIDCAHAATGAGGTGHRAQFHTTATAKLGGWANAVRAYFEFGTNGDITGLAAGACVEVKLPNANHSGTVCVLELELVDQASSGVGSGTSFIRCRGSGTMTAMNTSGYLFDIQGFAQGSNTLIDSDGATLTGDGGIKCRVGADDIWLIYRTSAPA